MKIDNLQQQSDENIIDMTPMLDIVFIMLIFFIVTTSFVVETGIDVNRPKATTAQVKKKNSIMVAITENGDIWLDKRIIDIRSLRAHIERLKVQMPESGVVLVSDKNAKTKHLIYAMDQIKLAGISNIAIAAKKEQ